ncbi:MAG: hypothetical protein ACREEX_00180, partial [Caulobacteraceae bacterium]
NTQPDGLDMVRLEVNDETAGYELATRSLTRKAWTAAMAYQRFAVPFTLPPGHAGDELEFRTYFYPYSYIRVGEVGLAGVGRPQNGPQPTLGAEAIEAAGWGARTLINSHGERRRTSAKRSMTESVTRADSVFVPYNPL